MRVGESRSGVTFERLRGDHLVKIPVICLKRQVEVSGLFA